ncbi:hypothetical protein BpHYR1_053251 [Brachionus plicatilis]|uniref:Uncharacterized protein n=1 Tax=Brachionus plicatilis TaxID=10195 RepID=A0A3M7S2L4_BRAPC|nr:hypothetical protein BpHYR1_053251 [Brachionus plicatilis]
MCKRRSSCCCLPVVPLLSLSPVPIVPLMPALPIPHPLLVAPLMHGLPLVPPFGLHGFPYYTDLFQWFYRNLREFTKILHWFNQKNYFQVLDKVNGTVAVKELTELFEDLPCLDCLFSELNSSFCHSHYMDIYFSVYLINDNK